VHCLVLVWVPVPQLVEQADQGVQLVQEGEQEVVEPPPPPLGIQPLGSPAPASGHSLVLPLSSAPALPESPGSPPTAPPAPPSALPPSEADPPPVA